MRHSIIKTAILIGAMAIAPRIGAQEASENIHYRWIDSYYRNSDLTAQKCANPRRVIIPGIPGYNAYKADLHVHTIFSDAQVTPQMRVMEAWLEGVDVLAITDHHPNPRTGYDKGDRNASYIEAEKYAAEAGVKLIKGFELTGNEPVGHMCILFLDELNKYKMTVPVTPEQADRIIAMAVEDKAFIITNHPGWPDQNSTLSDYVISHIQNGDIQAMEVFNSNEYYPLAIDHCNNYNLAMVAATDTHYPTYFLYNQETSHRPMTIIFAKDDSDEALKEALAARRTIAWADDNLFGNPELLSHFMRSCIKVEWVRQENGRIRCRLYNRSAVPFTLETSNPQYIIRIPADGYAEFSRRKTDLQQSYTVTNVHTSATGCLQMPLSYLLQGESPVSMPYVDESSLAFVEEGLSFRLTAQEGDTYYTTDGSEPGTGSARYDGGTLLIRESCPLRAVTVKDGEKSAEFTRNLPFSMAVKVKKSKPGVSFTMYEHDDILSTKDIEKIGVPVLSGTYARPCITDGFNKDHFGYIFKGYITIPVSGCYEFKLLTNDGSDLFIGGQLACDNDQNKGYNAATGSIFLEKGTHPMVLRYFEGYGGESFEFQWKTPGSPLFEPVPDSVFSY